MSGGAVEDDIEYVQIARPNPGGQQVGCYVPPLVAFHRATGIAFFVHDPERSQHKMKAQARDGLVALLALAEENAKMRAELAEAIRSLGLRTGLRNWENAIKSRVERGVTEVRCDGCGGSGTESRDRWDVSDSERSCHLCGGAGRVMQDVTPKALLALSPAKEP